MYDSSFIMTYPKALKITIRKPDEQARDGLEGNCIAYFSVKDLTKLEKFLRDKPVAEREMGALLLQEVEAYAESSAC